jgi:hypothetical protein
MTLSKSLKWFRRDLREMQAPWLASARCDSAPPIVQHDAAPKRTPERYANVMAAWRPRRRLS